MLLRAAIAVVHMLAHRFALGLVKLRRVHLRQLVIDTEDRREYLFLLPPSSHTHLAGHARRGATRGRRQTARSAVGFPGRPRTAATRGGCRPSGLPALAAGTLFQITLTSGMGGVSLSRPDLPGKL